MTFDFSQIKSARTGIHDVDICKTEGQQKNIFQE